VIDSAVITGTADLRFMGITFPSRLRFTHDAGRSYRHYIEATIWGWPLLRVNEHFIEGRGRLELPFGTIENDPKTDSAGNLGLWGESIWLPTLFITDPRVRWEAIDDTTARLIVPVVGTEAEDSFTVHFDAETGLLTSMEALRWKNSSDMEKTRWILEARGWIERHGMWLVSPGAVTWAGDSAPWLVMSVDDVAYNADVSAYIRARGL
ncbi:MAG: hypothetical protein GYB67_10840, partial [Chloroflexi bacterium]|nr:hypothetical protein [Chloroflexota bacterium]